MTVQLKKFNCKCRKLCEKARISGKESDFERYRNYRKVLNRVKLHVKRVHYDEVFKKIGTNSKLLWNVINGLLRKSNNKTEITELLYNSEVLTNKNQISGAFNEHFSTAGKRIQSSISPLSSGSQTVNDPLKFVKRINVNLKFSMVSESYVTQIVQHMKSKTSSGNDGVSNMLMKQIISVIKSPLCVLINRSLNTGIFPDLMKIAKVIPLHKGDELYLPDNFRPISLLPVLSKILEKVVYDKIAL